MQAHGKNKKMASIIRNNSAATFNKRTTDQLPKFYSIYKTLGGNRTKN